MLTDIDAVATSGPIVFGYDEEAGVRMSSWSSAGWITDVTGIDEPAQQLRYGPGGIDIDSEQRLHMAAVDLRPTHYNAWDKIHLYRQQGASWSGGEVEDFFVAGLPKLKVDSEDTLHLVYSDRSYPDYSGTRLVHATWDGESYDSEVIFTPVDPYNRSNGDAKEYQLATDGVAAHILWVETIHYTGQVRLRYSTNLTGSWTHEILEAPFPVRQITKTSLLIDAEGRPHILYKMGYDDFYAHKTDDSWLTETAPTTGIFRLSEGDVPTIAVGGNGAIQTFSRLAADDWELLEIPTRRSI